MCSSSEGTASCRVAIQQSCGHHRWSIYMGSEFPFQRNPCGHKRFRQILQPALAILAVSVAAVSDRCCRSPRAEKAAAIHASAVPLIREGRCTGRHHPRCARSDTPTSSPRLGLPPPYSKPRTEKNPQQTAGLASTRDSDSRFSGTERTARPPKC